MYSITEMNKKVEAWMKRSESRQYLRKRGIGIYSPSEMKTAANKLSRKIANGFKTVVRSRTSPTPMPSISVDEKNGVVSLTYDKQSLHRDSLLRYDTKKPIDGGVKDIFALFTTGWPLGSSRGQAYGYWDHATKSKTKYIRACMAHDGSDWISAAVHDIESEYIGLQVKYPSTWGG